MAGTEIEKPSRVTQIPTAPGIKLENLIQFDGDCIDPVALIVITEALDYALESSARRLSSLGKIFSGVEETAYNSGKGVLPTIKAIREAILFAPQCTPEGPKVMPPPTSVEEAIITEAKRRTVTQAKPSTPEAAITAQAVRGVPKKTRPTKEEIVEEMVKASAVKRGQPELWGAATFIGTGKEAKLSGEYDSPGALAKALKIQTRGAKDMTIAFRRAGFEVRGDGEKAEKGKTGFLVRRVGATPREYRLIEEPEFGEYEGPGRLAL